MVPTNIKNLLSIMRKSKNNKDQLLIFFNLDTKNCLRLNDYEKEFSHNLLDGRKEIKYFESWRNYLFIK